jgi:cell division protein ZapA (FtsZ GTPase activity inhibitor)
MLAVLRALVLVLQAIPALREIAAQVERIHREREGASRRAEKDRRNDEAIRAANDRPPQP